MIVLWLHTYYVGALSSKAIRAATIASCARLKDKTLIMLAVGVDRAKMSPTPKRQCQLRSSWRSEKRVAGHGAQRQTAITLMETSAANASETRWHRTLRRASW